jgi:hypothetical protein
MVVNLCAPRAQPPYFTFIRMRILVLNYARSSGTRPSHDMQPHCTVIVFVCVWHSQTQLLWSPSEAQGVLEPSAP